MSSEFGKLLKNLRTKVGLTQEELAQKVGVSQQSLAKWEAGKAAPRSKVVVPLSAALDATFDELEKARRLDDWRRRWGSTEVAPKLQSEEFEQQKDGASQQAHPTHRNRDMKEQIKSIVAPLLETVSIRQGGAWNSVFQSGPIGWRVDYIDKTLVVQFVTTQSAEGLSFALRTSVRAKLWEMATLRAHLNDSKSYMMILTLPDSVSLEVDADRRPRPAAPNSMVFSRISKEASLLNIYVFLARSPRDVVDYMASSPSGVPDYYEGDDDEIDDPSASVF